MGFEMRYQQSEKTVELRKIFPCDLNVLNYGTCLAEIGLHGFGLLHDKCAVYHIDLVVRVRKYSCIG